MSTSAPSSGAMVPEPEGSSSELNRSSPLPPSAPSPPSDLPRSSPLQDDGDLDEGEDAVASRSGRKDDLKDELEEEANGTSSTSWLFTDDELLDVLRHLSVDGDGAGAGEEEGRILFVDADVGDGDDLCGDTNTIGNVSADPFTGATHRGGHKFGDGTIDGAPSSFDGDGGVDLLWPLPDLLENGTFMESDDPNDPLSWLVDDLDLVNWRDDGSEGGGLDHGSNSVDDEDDDDDANENESTLDGIEGGFDDVINEMHAWGRELADAAAAAAVTTKGPRTLASSTSTSSSSVTSSTLRPDMFLDNDSAAVGDNAGTGGTNDVLDLLDQLGDLQILDNGGAGIWGNPPPSSDAAGGSPRSREDRWWTPGLARDDEPPQVNAVSPSPQREGDDGDESENDEDPIPYYLYCQPCTPQHIQEQQEILDRGRTHVNGIVNDDTGIDDGNWEDDFASRLRLDDNSEPGEDNDPQHLQRPRKRRPEALGAVQFLLDTFGATMYEATSSPTENEAATPDSKRDSPPPERERMGIGHRERILGMDTSECGRFVATAGQDGTAKVWDARANRLLSTIVHNPRHPNDHECLRVTFAPVSWGFHRLPPALAMMPSAVASPPASFSPQASAMTTSTPHVLDLASSPRSRYLLATGGADGRVCVWSCDDPASATTNPWTLQTELDHAALNRYFAPESDSDTPQIYSLQFVSHWRSLPTAPRETQNSFLLTSSDDFVHLWEIVPPHEESAMMTELSPALPDGDVLNLREVMSIRFGNMRSTGWGVHVLSVTEDGLIVPEKNPIGEGDEDDEVVANTGSTPKDGPTVETESQYRFGGDRNPHHLVYVFDGRYCPSNGLLAVALSDGTLRLVNGRGVCVTLLHLPGFNSHLTSFAFDSTGTRLATTVATGHVILWDLELDEHPRRSGFDDGENDEATTSHDEDRPVASNDVLATCRAVLNGHEAGRPVFGAAYCGLGENVLLSWGVDGRICAWDSLEDGEADGPLSVLLHKPEYPIYAVSLRPDGLSVAGGGSEPSFVGVPVYFYDFDDGAATVRSTAATTRAAPSVGDSA